LVVEAGRVTTDLLPLPEARSPPRLPRRGASFPVAQPLGVGRASHNPKSRPREHRRALGAMRNIAKLLCWTNKLESRPRTWSRFRAASGRTAHRAMLSLNC